MCLAESSAMSYGAPMVRKSLLVCAAVAALLVANVGAAAAAPPTAALSSWESTVEDGTIIGGNRTLSVTNITDETLVGTAVELNTVPCDCVVESFSGPGEITGNLWLVPDLEPGATAEVTMVYGERAPSGFITASTELESWAMIVVAFLVLLLGIRNRMHLLLSNFAVPERPVRSRRNANLGAVGTTV